MSSSHRETGPLLLTFSLQNKKFFFVKWKTRKNLTKFLQAIFWNKIDFLVLVPLGRLVIQREWEKR